MTGCRDCGMRTSWPAVDLGVNMHAHQAPGAVACHRHGPGQPVMAIHGDPRQAILCRACWTDIYAHTQAFIHAAIAAIKDHNEIQAASIQPVNLDLGAMMRHVAGGRCWCGRQVTLDGRSATGITGRCEAGHAYTLHRFDGGNPA